MKTKERKADSTKGATATPALVARLGKRLAKVRETLANLRESEANLGKAWSDGVVSNDAYTPSAKEKAEARKRTFGVECQAAAYERILKIVEAHDDLLRLVKQYRSESAEQGAADEDLSEVDAAIYRAEVR